MEIKEGDIVQLNPDTTDYVDEEYTLVGEVIEELDPTYDVITVRWSNGEESYYNEDELIVMGQTESIINIFN